MKKEINPIFGALAAGKVNVQDVIKTYFHGRAPNENDLIHLFRNGIENRNRIDIEEFVLLISINIFPVSSFTSQIGELITMPWHVNHEDMASLLGGIADPKTVQSLYDATELQFEYLLYDDTYQFARKCIKALSTIGNDNAISKLRLLANSKIEKIEQYAKKELSYKGLL